MLHTVIVDVNSGQRVHSETWTDTEEAHTERIGNIGKEKVNSLFDSRIFTAM